MIPKFDQLSHYVSTNAVEALHSIRAKFLDKRIEYSR